MESSEFSQEEEQQDQDNVEEIDEQPAGTEEDVEPEGGGATDTEGTPETSGESA